MGQWQGSGLGVGGSTWAGGVLCEVDMRGGLLGGVGVVWGLGWCGWGIMVLCAFGMVGWCGGRWL